MRESFVDDDVAPPHLLCTINFQDVLHRGRGVRLPLWVSVLRCHRANGSIGHESLCGGTI